MNFDMMYYGYLKNKDELLHSTSGGVARGIYQEYLKNGSIVYGVAWNNDFKGAHYERIINVENLSYICSTKYVKASLKLKNGKMVLESVIDDLKDNQKVLFIGLPCEVASLKKICEKKHVDTKNLFLVDLICHGPVSNNVFAEFIDNLEKKYKSKIKYINLRYKDPYWNNSCLKIEFANNNVVYRKLHETEFGIAFNIYGMEQCYKCKFRGENHASDVTIGDYWGADEKDESYESKGMSILITHNEKGKNILENSEIIFGKVKDEDGALKNNPYYANERNKDSRREKFIELYNRKGLAFAVHHMTSIRERIRIYYPKLDKLLKCIKRIL